LNFPKVREQFFLFFCNGEPENPWNPSPTEEAPATPIELLEAGKGNFVIGGTAGAGALKSTVSRLYQT